MRSPCAPISDGVPVTVTPQFLAGLVEIAVERSDVVIVNRFFPGTHRNFCVRLQRSPPYKGRACSEVSLLTQIFNNGSRRAGNINAVFMTVAQITSSIGCETGNSQTISCSVRSTTVTFPSLCTNAARFSRLTRKARTGVGHPSFTSSFQFSCPLTMLKLVKYLALRTPRNPPPRGRSGGRWDDFGCS